MLLPLLLLGTVEISLRIVGYGYPTEFFKRIRIGSEDFLVDNDKVGLRFFPPTLARSPVPVVMKAKKPADAYRIFILGESAALGDPRPAYGAGRYLQALLKERFPGVEFEVVCVAMTAINSHAVLTIARECARHEGDLWIIYMGNNEMVGPFGVSTVFGAPAPRLGFVRLSLAMQKTRTGQLLAVLARKLRGGGANTASWEGMKMFLNNRIPSDDPRKEVVYTNFRRNLEDILQAGLGSGAKIILSTVAVNLRDCPPFASLPNTNLSATDQKRYDIICSNAATFEVQGNLAGAARLWENAAKIDPKFAELEFRLGNSHLRLRNYGAARERFELACDYDALPFRTDSKINAIIDEFGRRYSGRGLRLFNAVAALAEYSPTHIPGRESFYEHVHLNFDGNYRLARAWAEEVQHLLPVTLTNLTVTDWASQEICERRLALTDWNRVTVIENIIQRLSEPPFTSLSNNATELTAFRNELSALHRRMDTNAAVKARNIYLKALKLAPDDHSLHANAAEFLEAVGDLPQATVEWQKVRDLIPHHHVAYFQIGRLLARQGKLAEAESSLLKAVRLHPDLGAGWIELGEIHAAEDKLALALREFERAHQLLPQDYLIPFHLGRVLSKLGRRDEAIQNYREAIHLRPGYWEARYLLAGDLASNGQVAAARTELEEVLRLKPDHVMAHLNLGVALFKLGRMDEATQQVNEALRLDPQNKIAQEYSRELQTARSRP